MAGMEDDLPEPDLHRQRVARRGRLDAHDEFEKRMAFEDRRTVATALYAGLLANMAVIDNWPHAPERVKKAADLAVNAADALLDRLKKDEAPHG